MRNIWAKLPSSRTLIVFEAAARLGSFTHAAAELNVQQPSVSSGIKLLEQALGIQLFVRGHRKVALTAAGERLFSDVSRAMTEINASLLAVQQMGRSAHATLSSSSAFSYYWMMPKLNQLRERHPEIDLRMQISDREPDLDAENIDLAIRLGNGKWSGYHAARLADEVIFPVARPQVMAVSKNLRVVSDLLNERLIHLEEPVRERPTWSQWFDHHGIADHDVSLGLRLNDYALVLQAAVSGEGFAFGWEHVVRNLMGRNMLVALQEWSWKTGNGIYLLWSKKNTLSDSARLVRDWMISVSDFPLGMSDVSVQEAK